jgi:hypothetical protein
VSTARWNLKEAGGKVLNPPPRKRVLDRNRIKDSTSYWRTADIPILKHPLTNRYLESLGFPDVLKRFEMLHERIGILLKLRMSVLTH